MPADMLSAADPMAEYMADAAFPTTDKLQEKVDVAATPTPL